MPQGAVPLKLGWQRDRANFSITSLCVWALVNPNAIVADKQFYICTTGDEVPQWKNENSPWKYLDTAMNNDGQYILHVFFS